MMSRVKSSGLRAWFGGFLDCCHMVSCGFFVHGRFWFWHRCWAGGVAVATCLGAHGRRHGFRLLLYIRLAWHGWHLYILTTWSGGG